MADEHIDTIWLTQEAYDAASAELELLKGEGRATVTAKIARARDEDLTQITANYSSLGVFGGALGMLLAVQIAAGVLAFVVMIVLSRHPLVVEVKRQFCRSEKMKMLLRAG